MAFALCVAEANTVHSMNLQLSLTQMDRVSWCRTLFFYITVMLLFANLFCFSLFKEGVKMENNEHINLKVAGQDGSVVQFKIKRHTPLNKLMKAYCERQVRLLLQISHLTFIFSYWPEWVSLNLIQLRDPGWSSQMRISP